MSEARLRNISYMLRYVLYPQSDVAWDTKLKQEPS